MLIKLPFLLLLALCSAQDLDSIFSQMGSSLSAGTTPQAATGNSVLTDEELSRRLEDIFTTPPSSGSDPGGTIVPLPTFPTTNGNSVLTDEELNRRLNQIFTTAPPSGSDLGGTIVPQPTSPTTNGNSVLTDEELRNRVNGIFTTAPPAGSDPAPSGTTTNIKCITNSGAPGVCVTHNLCNKRDAGSNDGTGVINIRMQGPCGSYLLTCCLLSDTRQVDNPITPKPEPNEKDRTGCGWHNPKGVGIRTMGELQGETKFGEFPWMCAILKHEPAGRDDDPNSMKLNVYVGGGSLIHPSIVLTAAHIIALAPTMRVRAGEWDTQSTKEPYPYQDREVARAEIHKDHNDGNLFYDVALLFLAKPLNLAPNVQPICLPPPKENPSAGTRCFATGWGKDKFGDGGQYQVISKKVEVPVVDRNTCQSQLRNTRLGNDFDLHSSFMCAGGELGIDMCQGDGGAPLSCPTQDEPGRFVQSGIVAWGIGCGSDGVPGVYADVAYLRSWIDDKVIGAGFNTTAYSY